MLNKTANLVSVGVHFYRRLEKENTPHEKTERYSDQWGNAFSVTVIVIANEICGWSSNHEHDRVSIHPNAAGKNH